MKYDKYVHLCYYQSSSQFIFVFLNNNSLIRKKFMDYLVRIVNMQLIEETIYTPNTK